MSLDEALRALDAAERVPALELLLEAWRAQPWPRLADAIDVVSRDLTRSLPPIASDVSPDHDPWLALDGLHRAADVPRLVAALPTLPALLRGRIERLAARPRDPRIALALARLVAERPGMATPHQPMWRQIFGLLVSIGDARVRPLLAAESAAEIAGPASVTSFFHERLSRTLAQLAPEPTPPTLEEAALLARIAARADELHAGPPVSEAHLFALPRSSGAAAGRALERAIAEHPDDDSLRQVYGDWLSERGAADPHAAPRGELIALQYRKLTQPLTAAEERQERALLQQHGRAWLGAIEPVVDAATMVFERGFLASCSAVFASDRQAADLVSDPHWATVRQVATARVELITHPVMRSLEAAHGPSLHFLSRLCCHGAPLPLEALAVDVSARDRLSSVERDWIARARSLPSLRRLDLVLLPPASTSWPSYPWLKGALGARLERLGLIRGGHGFERALNQVDVGAWLELATELPRLRQLDLDVGSDYRFTFQRQADGPWQLELTIRRLDLDGLAACLQALPPTGIAAVRASFAGSYLRDEQPPPELEALFAAWRG